MTENIGECIEWHGYRNMYGYGWRTINKKQVYAHRVAYCEHHKITLESISGIEVRHRCDNRGCINPKHLELGTHAENMRDMAERRRAARLAGEKNGNAKLDNKKVNAIRSEYVKGSSEFGTYGLARKYRMSQYAIHRIVSGKSWR